MTEDINRYSYLTPKDLDQLRERGITPEMVEKQLSILRDRIYYPTLKASASTQHGIFSINEKEIPRYLSIWDKYRTSEQANIVKFVPASGAATRMFQDLFPLLKGEEKLSRDNLTPEQQKFFDNIEHFAFFPLLSESCLRNEWSSVHKLIEIGKYKAICEQLLTERGLNYAHTPKGLIPFHKYPYGQVRTATEEHLAEGAYYTKSQDGEVKVHFTVADNAEESFRAHIDKIKSKIEENFGVILDVDFSVQSHATDTVALDENGDIFRDEKGNILFRPGGHGSLIGNLGSINADIVFIKNIDNVTLDFLKSDTIRYKKLIGGILIAVRKTIFDFLDIIDKGKVSRQQIESMLSFMREVLLIDIPQQQFSDERQIIETIHTKLNRPLRVCGMVPNENEPGGGPFILLEPDGTTSLQILEKSQLDPHDEHSQAILERSRYFNPVDLVCSIRDYKGRFFHLEDYVSPRANFLSRKSYKGKLLLALEHPGLWNGAMDRWNTIFVSVPSSTFSPVKTCNDLLRPEHLRLT